MSAHGGVRERPNRHAWKACEVQASVGSNPTPSAMNNEVDAMQIALDVAHETAGRNEVPVGAVIVHDGSIVARAGNSREVTGNPINHAEMLVIQEAAQKIGSWRLTECSLFVTLEPCLMCAGAVIGARIPKLVFGAFDPAAGACGSVYNVLDDPRLNHRVEVIGGVRADDCRALLGSFFKDRR